MNIKRKLLTYCPKCGGRYDYVPYDYGTPIPSRPYRAFSGSLISERCPCCLSKYRYIEFGLSPNPDEEIRKLVGNIYWTESGIRPKEKSKRALELGFFQI